jgi:transposase
MFAILKSAAMQKLTFIAQVLVSKYGDHLPLYRASPDHARQGVNLDRNWVVRACQRVICRKIP